LVVGFLFKDKIKIIKDYASGSKSYSTPVLIANMVATQIGGRSTIRQECLNQNWFLSLSDANDKIQSCQEVIIILGLTALLIIKPQKSLPERV
jgi:hypothetical protein